MNIKGHVVRKSDGAAVCSVRVSDGRHICLTDDHGYFCMPLWDRSAAVFVMLLTNRHDDWYILTENHTGDYNFCVDPVQTGSESFCFLHISDTEIENSECRFIPILQKAAKENKPAFLVNTGDLCRRDGVERHFSLMNSRTVGCPVRYTIGNHDFLDGPYGEYRYERLYGPLWYSFDCGNIHFIAGPIKKGDYPSGYSETDFWEWLEADLKHLEPGKKIIILSHSHCDDLPGFRPTVGEKTYDLPKAGLIAWLFGHYHILSARDYSGILNICSAQPDCGGIDSSPGAVRRVNVCGQTVSTDVLFTCLTYPPDPFEWKTVLPGHVQFCDPTAYGDDIIVCTNDDGFPKSCGVFCLDGDGQVKWSLYTENGFKGSGALYDGRYFAQDSAGVLYCIDPQNGELIWKFQTRQKKIGDTRMNIVAANGRVFGGCPEKIQAFDCLTGRPLWQCRDIRSENSPARQVYDFENDRLIVNAHWNCMYAVDATNGEVVWSQVWDSQPGFPCPVWFRTSSPLLHGGRIYSSGNTGVFVLDAASGALIVQRKTTCSMDSASVPIIDDGILYMGTGDSGVLALDPQTLEILFRFETGGAGLFTTPYNRKFKMTVESPLIIKDDQLIFSASDGCIYFYGKKDARLVKKIQLGAPCLTAPVIDGDTLTAADFYAAVTKHRI